MTPTTSERSPPDLGQAARVLTIAAAISCIAVAGVGLSLSSPLISLLLSAKGVSGAMIGFNTAVGSLGNLIVGAFVARLAAKLGLRLLLLSTLAIGAVSISLFAVFNSLAAWFVLRLIFGAAIGTLFVLSEFWINAAAPATRRGLIMGIYATALSLGFAGGPAILAVLGRADEMLFVVCAGFFFLAAIPILLVGTNAPPLEGKARHSVFAFVVLAPIATVAAYIYGAVEQSSFAFLPIYGEKLGLSARTSALLLMVFGLGNVVSQVPLGLLSDRWNRTKLLLGCACISGLAALAMPLAAGSVPGLMVLLFIAGGVIGGLYTIGLALLGAHFSGPELATANAAFVMLYSFGMMTGAPAMGVLVDVVEPHGFAFGFAFLCALYCGLIAWRLPRKAEE